MSTELIVGLGVLAALAVIVTSIRISRSYRASRYQRPLTEEEARHNSRPLTSTVITKTEDKDKR